MSSDYNLFKQFGPRSGMTNPRPDLVTLMVSLIPEMFWKKVNFEKKSADTKKDVKIHSMQRVKCAALSYLHAG